MICNTADIDWSNPHNHIAIEEVDWPDYDHDEYGNTIH